MEISSYNKTKPYVRCIKILSDVSISQIQKDHTRQTGSEHEFIGYACKVLIDQANLA